MNNVAHKDIFVICAVLYKKFTLNAAVQVCFEFKLLDVAKYTSFTFEYTSIL